MADFPHYYRRDNVCDFLFALLHIRIANSVDPDETAHYEPSHLDLHCLQRYRVWFTTLEGLICLHTFTLSLSTDSTFSTVILFDSLSSPFLAFAHSIVVFIVLIYELHMSSSDSSDSEELSRENKEIETFNQSIKFKRSQATCHIGTMPIEALMIVFL